MNSFDAMFIQRMKEYRQIKLAKQALNGQNEQSEPESQTPEALQCPKCLSYNVSQYGYSKVRKDGTRSQRILCKACHKTSTNGAKK